MLPPEYRIDYSRMCGRAPKSPKALGTLLRKHLPVLWQKVYAATTAHATNIVQIQRGAFVYFFDAYSGLETLGEIPFDQRVHDRVIGVLGRSEPRRTPRRGRLLNGSRNMPAELEGSSRDIGHFMAHCIGGGLDVNLFSQVGDLNRGTSERGKVYRQMEKFCYQNPGTFCFSRPIYGDSTSVPRWLEFGLVKSDGTLWVEAFEN